MSKKTYVLIDNDSLIHKVWEMAARKNAVQVHFYYNVEDFLKNIEHFAKDIFIYIDSELDHGVRGEIEAEKIFKLGFKEIYLATGQVDLDITSYPWVKSIVSKRPSF